MVYLEGALKVRGGRCVATWGRVRASPQRPPAPSCRSYPGGAGPQRRALAATRGSITRR